MASSNADISAALLQAFQRQDAEAILNIFDPKNWTNDDQPVQKGTREINEPFNLNGEPGTLLEHFLAFAKKNGISDGDVLEAIQALYKRLQEEYHISGTLLFASGNNLEPPAVESWIRQARANQVKKGLGITLGKRVPYDAIKAPLSYIEDGKPDGISFKKPTLLVLGGADSTDPRIANGMAKFARDLLLEGVREEEKDRRIQQIFGDNLQIVGTQYPEPRALLYHEIGTHNSTIKRIKDSYHPPYIQTLVEKKFLDLVKPDGKAIPSEEGPARNAYIEEIKRKMRNLNILTYSFGGIVLDEIGDVLYEEMKRLGYKPAEIDDIMKQVVVVTLGNVSHFVAGKAHFTGIHVFNKSDPVVDLHSANAAIASNRPQSLNFVIDENRLRQNLGISVSSEAASAAEEDNIRKYCGQITVRTHPDRNDHIVEVQGIPSHEVDDFLLPNFIEGMMIRNVLRNSVENSVRNTDRSKAFEEAPSALVSIDVPLNTERGTGKSASKPIQH